MTLPTAAPRVSGIVLAGGASRRFGSDKLSAPFAGTTTLARAIGALAELCTEVVVVLAPGDDRTLPQTAVPVRPVHDPERHGGPLVGLLAGLEAAAEPIVLAAGGDMPTMSGAVLRTLVAALTAAEGAEAVLLVRRSVDQPLPAALRLGAATQAARRLVAEDERSLRALMGRLRLRRLREADWRLLDPEAATLRDIDRPTDLLDRQK
jgi:molybdopterin-guanine dinucleotide biosynthesis protein A